VAIIANSPRLYELVDPNARVERIATGFEFTEGPLWLPSDDCLLFTDIIGDKIYRWKNGRTTEYRSPSNKANGLSLDSGGRLIICEHTTSRLARVETDGTVTTLASHYMGKEINSPNDVVVKSDGAIYFSDPPNGREEHFGTPRPEELGFRGVFRVPPGGGDLMLIADDFEIPNGLCFSPDESILYVNDSLRFHIRAFDVNADGSVSNGRIFFTERNSGNPHDGTVDGMKCDVDGNVYVTGPGGIWVVTPQGEHLGVIETPERLTARPDAPFICDAANLNWGGPDWSTLYITATHSVYRVPMRVSGNRLAYMR
jgi:gluconolactonase